LSALLGCNVTTLCVLVPSARPLVMWCCRRRCSFFLNTFFCMLTHGVSTIHAEVISCTCPARAARLVTLSALPSLGFGYCLAYVSTWFCVMFLLLVFLTFSFFIVVIFFGDGLL